MGIRQKANRKKLAAAKAALKAAGDAFSPKILKTKESRRKLHRWTFESQFTRAVPIESVTVDSTTGEETKTTTMEDRTLRHVLSNVLVGNQTDADKAARDLEAELANPDIRGLTVTPIPHETISPAIYKQLMGMHDFNHILQTAYEIVVEDLVAGKSPISLDLGEAKQRYYEQAISRLRPPKAEPEQQIIAPEEHNDPIDLAKLQEIAISPELV